MQAGYNSTILPAVTAVSVTSALVSLPVGTKLMNKFLPNNYALHINLIKLRKFDRDAVVCL